MAEPFVTPVVFAGISAAAASASGIVSVVNMFRAFKSASPPPTIHDAFDRAGKLLVSRDKNKLGDRTKRLLECMELTEAIRPHLARKIIGTSIVGLAILASGVAVSVLNVSTFVEDLESQPAAFVAVAIAFSVFFSTPALTRFSSQLSRIAPALSKYVINDDEREYLRQIRALNRWYYDEYVLGTMRMITKELQHSREVRETIKELETQDEQLKSIATKIGSNSSDTVSEDGKKPEGNE